MRRIVAAAVTADAAAPGLPAEGSGARPGRAAMTAALTTEATATAAATAVVCPGDPTATATTGRRVTRYRNVVQGQDAGVENPPPMAPVAP